MYNIKHSFDRILSLVKQILGNNCPNTGNFLRPGLKPKFTDIEVIALSITAECLSIDSENRLFTILHKEYTKEFPNLLSRRQYNDRRKHLFNYQELIRNHLVSAMNDLIDVYAVDSMPLEICKMARMERNKMGKENEYTAPDKGYCASQDKWYYGYKMHSACAPSGVIQHFDLARASIHDNHFVTDLCSNFKDCLIIGDKGYIINPDDNKALLLKESGIELNMPYRTNQKDKKPQLYILKKLRKRIETIFSQLCDQFMIQRNYAKSFVGYRIRIHSKISGMTILQYINKFVTGRPIGQIKYALNF